MSAQCCHLEPWYCLDPDAAEGKSGSVALPQSGSVAPETSKGLANICTLGLCWCLRVMLSQGPY